MFARRAVIPSTALSWWDGKPHHPLCPPVGSPAADHGVEDALTARLCGDCPHLPRGTEKCRETCVVPDLIESAAQLVRQRTAFFEQAYRTTAAALDATCEREEAERAELATPIGLRPCHHGMNLIECPTCSKALAPRDTPTESSAWPVPAVWEQKRPESPTPTEGASCSKSSESSSQSSFGSPSSPSSGASSCSQSESHEGSSPLPAEVEAALEALRELLVNLDGLFGVTKAQDYLATLRTALTTATDQHARDAARIAELTHDCNSNALIAEGYREELCSFATWADSYPTSVWHEPDVDELKAAHEALTAAGLGGIDALSAMVYRHALQHISERARTALDTPEED